MESSGFLGTFHATINSNGLITVHDDEGYLALVNASGDEIDIQHGFFPVGVNTTNMKIYNCHTQVCGDAHQFNMYAAAYSSRFSGQSARTWNDYYVDCRGWNIILDLQEFGPPSKYTEMQ